MCSWALSGRGLVCDHTMVRLEVIPTLASSRERERTDSWLGETSKGVMRGPLLARRGCVGVFSRKEI